MLRSSLAGRYDVERELGEGGMATVYLAHDVRHARKVADVVVELLEQVLPLDDERLAEAQIWLAFTPRALIDPQLRAVRRQADDGVRELCRQCLLGLSGFGLMTPERSLRQ